MANTIRIKRRASGDTGAPASLENAELAFNEVGDVLFYGKGTGGANGSATSVIAVGGTGAFVDRTTTQSISGVKTFTDLISGSVSGNAGTATKWATARNLALTGDATATLAAVDGTSNVSAALTFATVNANVGTFTKVTVNGKGLVTAAALATLNEIEAPTADYSFNNKKLTNLADPTNDTDAANKRYVNSVAQGLSVKDSVRVSTTSNITLSGEQTIDGIAVVAGDRVLVKEQTSEPDNGIYVAATGAWARSVDANTFEKLISAFVFVEDGTQLADTGFVCTVIAGGTLGQTPITFSQFSGAGTFVAGTGLTLTGGEFSITDTTVTAGSFGGASQTLTATVNAQGQLTALAASAIAITNAQVSGLGTMSTQNANNVNITGGSIVGLTTFDDIEIDGGTF